MRTWRQEKEFCFKWEWSSAVQDRRMTAFLISWKAHTHLHTYYLSDEEQLPLCHDSHMTSTTYEDYGACQPLLDGLVV